MNILIIVRHVLQKKYVYLVKRIMAYLMIKQNVLILMIKNFI